MHTPPLFRAILANPAGGVITDDTEARPGGG
jgi:hypothetical protein